MLGRTAEIVIASLFLVFGLLAALVWIPLDSETAMIETHRRQTSMGDAFLPIVAAGLIAVCAAVQLLLSLRRTDTSDTEGPVLDGQSMAFLVQFFGITAISLAVMYWAGPLAVSLFAEDGATYRQLRGTYPYKLLGFVLGGTALVFFITAMVEGRMKATRIISSVLMVAALIAIFDLPFDTVLLPPNGDF